MNTGWVKLHRQVLTNEIFRHDRTAWHVFQVLLLVCDKKTGKWSGGRFQLADLCNENPATTYKALKRLEKAKMVTLSSNTKYTTIYICKWSDFQEAGNTKREQRSNNGVTTGEHSNKKENKNNISKDILGKPEINELFDYWTEKTGIPISSKIQMNRNACNNLLKKNGMENTKRLIDGVALAQSDKYAPGIADFIQLQSKLSELLVWGKKNTKKTVAVPRITIQEQIPDYRGSDSPAKEKLRKDLEKLRNKVTV